MEERIRRRASKLLNDPTKRNGSSTVQVHNNEIINSHEQEERLNQQEERLKVLEQQLDNYMSDVTRKESEISRLSRDLQAATSEPIVNIGKGIEEVSKRQRRRKLNIVKENCQQALWFTRSYHLDGVKIIFKISGTDECIEIPLTTTPCTSISTAVNAEDKIQPVLYILDRFAVSDEFYHEMSMLHTDLPHSYLIKKQRALLNSTVELKRLPSPFHGCFRSFREYLMECIRRKVIHLIYSYISLLTVLIL